ncbi:MAG TPA: hypothetical protein VJZ91_02540, partial [Blastocatellia bacterium]|nr:hypothetical protein [Blastocatellia bacterium]
MVAQLNYFGESLRAVSDSDYTMLDHNTKSEESLNFEHQLRSRVIGQDSAVQALAQLYQVYQAGLNMPGRPIGTLLFLGPTGTGKTKSVEAAAEIL